MGKTWDSSQISSKALEEHSMTLDPRLKMFLRISNQQFLDQIVIVGQELEALLDLALDQSDPLLDRRLAAILAEVSQRLKEERLRLMTSQA